MPEFEVVSVAQEPQGASPGSGPRQQLPGTRHHRYRCSLPGLAEFTADRRGEADADRRRLSPLGG